jgi:hypothetical protein
MAVALRSEEVEAPVAEFFDSSPSTPALRAYAQDERLLGESELLMRSQNEKGMTRMPYRDAVRAALMPRLFP